MKAIWLWGKRLAFVVMMSAAPVAVAMSDGPRGSSPMQIASVAGDPGTAAQTKLEMADKTPDPGILLIAIIGIGILALTLRSRPAVKRVSS